MNTETTLAARLRQIATRLNQVESRDDLDMPIGQLEKIADEVERMEIRHRPGVQGHGTD